MANNSLSIGFFFAFMALTLLITYWAARRTRTTEHFFAAGGEITAWQNGWALAGDFLSAAALLGIAGIVTSNGFDGMVYSIGWLGGLADHPVSDRRATAQCRQIHVRGRGRLSAQPKAGAARRGDPVRWR